MNFLLDLYLHLRIRTRIILLCICYSFCIVFAVVAGRSFSLTLSVVSTTVFLVLGAFFIRGRAGRRTGEGLCRGRR